MYVLYIYIHIGRPGAPYVKTDSVAELLAAGEKMGSAPPPLRQPRGKPIFF